MSVDVPYHGSGWLPQCPDEETKFRHSIAQRYYFDMAQNLKLAQPDYVVSLWVFTVWYSECLHIGTL